MTGMGLAGGAITTSPACAASGRLPGQLRFGGTGMALAAMRQVGDAFATRHPGVSIEVLPSLGTGGGLAAVAAGAIDVALSARPLTAAEQARQLHAAAYARTPIAFVTHAETAVRGIQSADVTRILSGGMMAWPDGTPLRLIRREPSDADWTMLRSLSPAMEQAVAVALQRPGLLTVATDQDNADALERMRGSFGALSLGQLRAELRRLIPLELDGVPPTVSNIAAGRYALSRTLHITWHGEPTRTLASFLAFLSGEEARELLTRLDHHPLDVGA